MQTRLCSGCKKEKVITDFYIRANGCTGQCKFCELNKNRERARLKTIEKKKKRRSFTRDWGN